MKDVVQYDALQRLTLFHLMQTIGRENIYFLNQVFLKFSGLRQDNPFSTTFGTNSLAVIQVLDPEQITAMPINELIDFIKEKSKNRFADPEEIALYLPSKDCPFFV